MGSVMSLGSDPFGFNGLRCPQATGRPAHYYDQYQWIFENIWEEFPVEFQRSCGDDISELEGECDDGCT